MDLLTAFSKKKKGQDLQKSRVYFNRCIHIKSHRLNQFVSFRNYEYEKENIMFCTVHYKINMGLGPFVSTSLVKIPVTQQNVG